MKHTYTYRIDSENLPKGAEACIVWALTEWSKASKGRIQFFRLHGSPEIMFSGAEPPPNEASPNNPFEAYHFDLGRGVHSIIFDPAVNWATTWWHRAFTDRADLRTLALHEIGHVLLGPDHSDDPESIMYFKPKRAAIDTASLNLLS